MIYKCIAASAVISFFLLTSVSAQNLQKPVTVNGITILPDQQKDHYVKINLKSGRPTMTDSTGRFKVEISKFPDTLTFRLIGYVTTTRIFRSERDIPSQLTIRMVPEAVDLQDVEISTGYQRVKANEINGAVSMVDEKMLNARTGTNVLDRLVGQSSGLIVNTGKTNGNPQNKTNISIRGIGTINGPLDPLIVLDGYIYEGDINNINPNDVESVSILKDASASSIWGARAGNGVVVISSKKGKYNQDRIVSFNANTTIRQVPDLSSFSQMTAPEYIDFERNLFDRGYFDARISSGNLSLTPAVELFLARRLGKISQAQEQEALDKLRGNDTRKSYENDFYTNAVLQQYSLNLRGGSSKFLYNLTGAYENALNENYAKSDKYNLRFAQDFKITNKLTFSSSIALTAASSSSGRPVYNSINVAGRQPVYMDFVDENGNPIAVAQMYRNQYLDTLANGKFLDWKFYPANDYLHNTTSVKRNELYGVFGLKYQISDGLNVHLGYQFQWQDQKTENEFDSESYYSRNLVNSFSQYNRSTGVIRYIIPKGGMLRTANAVTSSSSGRLQVDYVKNIGLSSINAIAGVEAREVDATSNGMMLYGYQSDPLTFTNVDNVNTYPNSITGSSSQISSGTVLSDTRYRFMSVYTNLAYTFKGKYSASASIRRDGSNIFGASTNDKWKPLWSAGLGWDVAGERFYTIDWLPTLRFTATYGYSGNVDLSRTASPVAVYGTNALTGLPYSRVRNINNPDLKWEELSQFNVKVDFATRKNILTGSIAYYIKHGTDLYGLTPYDYTTWGIASEITKNVGDMKGNGFDAEFHSINLVKGNLKWSTDLYYSFNTSETVKYYTNGLTGLSALLGGGSTITPIVGKPLYAIAAYRWGGLDANGNPQGYLNGQLSTDYVAMAAEANATGDNLEYVGPASPTHFGSLINTLRYRNLSLSFNISYRFGYFTTKPTISYYALATTGVSHADYAQRWQKSGDEISTNIPSFVYPINMNRDAFFQSSQINVISADHIRLDYINLAYRFNAGVWKFPFRMLDVYVNANDIGILWRANKFGIDPDYVRSVSPLKGFTIGIKGSF
ncbi:SusC/RagA family TonB-linked outer membrane protein [Pedobacter sp. MW01-1-1]|uniref:SusC/RagA family TonB-linked outer membrane protein n=1 Tax=Pedobacter sp. MW01-1-1 TaxID=3383027 RepID=UPI003FEE8258